MFKINLNIDETYINDMIQFCENFIEKHRLKFTLEQLVFNFDRVTPMVDANKHIFKVYGNFKEELYDENIVIPSPKKDGKDIIGAKKVKKTKKQLFYYGKKDREKFYENERKETYAEVLQFCTHLRQLKTLIELEEEENRIKRISSDVEKMIENGF